MIVTLALSQIFRIFTRLEHVLFGEKLKLVAKAPAKVIGDYIIRKLLAPSEIDASNRLAAANMRVIEDGLFAAPFPIDVVYTWVDSSDPAFVESLNAYLPEERRKDPNESAARFKSHEELRYSLRSLEAYAPWINHIYIVTNGQRPHWLADHPKVTVVAHDQILPEEYLPTFNSHVIGSALHRIPNLSEHYIYFNDDVLLLRSLRRDAAFSDGGLSYAHIIHASLLRGPAQNFENANERAAKNSRDAILARHGIYFDRRFAHMFHTQRRSVAVECERAYADAYHIFRKNRLRGQGDLLCCSFLHHYEGYLAGKTLLTHASGVFVRVRLAYAVTQYQALLAERDKDEGAEVVCLNDYVPPSGELPEYEQALRSFLDAYYPKPTAFESRSVSAPSKR